jgi:hypothetical protein
MPVGRRTIKSMNRLCNRLTTLHTNKGHEMVAFMRCVPAVKHSDARSVVRGIKPYHRFISRKEDDMTTQHHQVITKILVSAAIAVGSLVGAAAPASAGPNPSGTEPNPFSALSCSCRETAPPGNPALTEEMEKGIWGGLSASPGSA